MFHIDSSDVFDNYIINSNRNKHGDYMLMKNLVLLVESLVANDAISKMCKWVKKDPESVACINEINKLKMVSFTIPTSSIDPAEYVITLHGRPRNEFKFQSDRVRYAEEIERVANPLMERIELYFSDLGFDDSYIGMSMVNNNNSYYGSIMLEFKFDLLKETDMLEDSELYQTLRDFGTTVFSSNTKVFSIFDRAAQNKAYLSDVLIEPMLVKGNKVFRVEFCVNTHGNNKLSDLSPMTMTLPSDINGGFTIGSGVAEVVEAIWDRHCHIDLKGLKYTTTTKFADDGLYIMFDYDANKLFKLLSDKYGR